MLANERTAQGVISEGGNCFRKSRITHQRVIECARGTRDQGDIYTLVPASPDKISDAEVRDASYPGLLPLDKT